MDEYQQIKGVVGHQLAKAFLCRVCDCEIAGEEVPVIGLDARAKLDIVAQDGRVYRPVEVKLQAYNHDWFGRAFEFVIDELAKGEPPMAHLGSGEVQLVRPILFLWYPPSKKFRPERYKAVEVIQVGDALDALTRECGDEAIKEIAADVGSMAEAFLSQMPGLRLTKGRRRSWDNRFNVG